MASSLFSLLLLVLVAVGYVSCTSPVGKEKGFVGVDAEGNLHVDAPEGGDVLITTTPGGGGGKVFVNGVDVLNRIESLEGEHDNHKHDLRSLKEEYKAEVGVLQRVLCDAGLVDLVTVAQTIDTDGAFDWEYFEIDGYHFLAVANYNTDNIPSVIYQWNRSTKQFKEAQSINTHGAYDWEHFVIDGVHFLALTNLVNNFNIPSVIYQWNNNTKQFEEAQSISTNGAAADWEHFEIDGVHFLALANNFNGNTHNNIPSVIYQWNNITKQFQVAQSINTTGAQNWEHFVIDGVHFLAAANLRNDNNFNIPSVIYQWNNITKQFQVAQSINTNGAWDWEHFEIDGVHFLALANHFNGNTYNSIPSVIYQWNSSTKQFEEAQSISTNCDLDWKHFEIDGVHFLAAANHRDDNTYNIPSVIYKWNNNTKQFLVAQSINTNGATDWEHFEIDGVHFLALANYYNGNSLNIPSVIYRLNPLCV